MSKYKKEYYEKNKEKIKQSVKKYRENNKEKIKLAKKKWQQSDKAKQYMKEYNNRPEVKDRFQKLQWKRKYGISEQDSKDLLEKQDHLCAICGTYLIKPYLDHCHITQNVRGFLCTQCNVGLGSFRDNKENLKNAIKYLEKSGAFEVHNKRILPSGRVA